MKSNEQHVPVLDFLYKKTGVKSQSLSETAENLENLMRGTFTATQPSKAQLREQVVNLQAQNKELGTYAATVAHDLKDPLYSLLLTSNLIMNAPELTQVELKNYVQRITSTAYQMNTIINSLLLFAKVSNTEALVEPVDMDRTVANVLDRLSDSINEHHAQIAIPESWPVAVGYAPWVEEVWANYLSNAIKHGGPPPRAELGASLQPNGMICYWVRDNGPGLSADDQARLFAPFSQLDPACNSGSGLGLSIVLRIVEKLGGQAGCESELGQGSLFFFTLPATASA